MKRLGMFTTTGLVALATGLPLLFSVIPSLSVLVEVLIFVAVVSVAVARDYLQNVRPSVDFERKREFVFGLVCDEAFERLKEIDSTVRLNVLEVVWRLPGKKWGRFDTVYPLNMENAPDANLKLNVDQGVAGDAFNLKNSSVADMEDPDAPTYNLDPEQRDKTKTLTLVFGTPIRKLDAQLYPTDEVIGIVVIDSRKKDARRFYEGTAGTGGEPSLRAEVLKVQEQMSVSLSRVLS